MDPGGCVLSKWHFFLLQVMCSSPSHSLMNALSDALSEKGLAADENQPKTHMLSLPRWGLSDMGLAAQAWVWGLWPLQGPPQSTAPVKLPLDPQPLVAPPQMC